MVHPKLDLDAVPARAGTGYPRRFHQVNGDIPARRFQPVGRGLTAFGANRVVLPPGAASSLRHWHSHEDELVVVVAGRCVMLSDEGDTDKGPGDIAVFPAGSENAHCFVNRAGADAVLVVVGNNSDDDECGYPDVGMRARSVKDGGGYVDAKTGAPYDDG
jgi:uncharacterized cupin superfamily protein